MDLAGEAGAFGKYPRFMLGRGELPAGSEQFLHERFALLCLAGQRLISEANEECDPGPHDRADDSSHAPAAVDSEGADRDEG